MVNSSQGNRPTRSDSITNGTTQTFPIDSKEEPGVEHVVGVRLPVEIGNFHLHLFTGSEGKEHLALVKGEIRGKGNILTRIHSECLTGDLFGSMRCDCGPQLQQSMKMIEEEGGGLLIYLRQAGRGIGLAEKLKAYSLQDQGLDTVDANLRLGHRSEEREYHAAAEILRDLGVLSIRLLSNNPDKINSLTTHGIHVSSRLPLPPPVTRENQRYLETKVSRMDHEIDFTHLSPSTPEREEILRYVKRTMEASDGDSDLFITLSYFQGLEGCISHPLPGSDLIRENLLLMGQLRETHDAFLTPGNVFRSLIGSLNEIFPDGFDSLPILIDEDLSLPLDYLKGTMPFRLQIPGDGPAGSGRPNAFLLTSKHLSDAEIESLISYNVRVLPIIDDDYQIDLPRLKRELADIGVTSLVVEGPQDVISGFLLNREADVIVSTVLPCFFGSGTECYTSRSEAQSGDFCMDSFRFNSLGGELVYFGLPDWRTF